MKNQHAVEGEMFQDCDTKPETQIHCTKISIAAGSLFLKFLIDLVFFLSSSLSVPKCLLRWKNKAKHHFTTHTL